MPESRQSLGPIRELMDKANEAKNGVKITCSSEGKAINLMYRLRKARRLDMDDAEKVYGDHECSAYAHLDFNRLGNVITIERAVGVGGIESVEEL